MSLNMEVSSVHKHDMKRNMAHLIAHVVYITLYLALVVSTTVFYNYARLMVFLFLGWPVLTLGIIFIVWASQSRKKRRSEREGKGVFVESGMYGIVRHPEYLGHIMVILGLAAISQHWASLTFAGALIVLLWLAMVEEEKRNIEKFGSAYKDYMRKVPRVNIIAAAFKRSRGKGFGGHRLS